MYFFAGSFEIEQFLFHFGDENITGMQWQTVKTKIINEKSIPNAKLEYCQHPWALCLSLTSIPSTGTRTLLATWEQFPPQAHMTFFHD